MTDGVAERKDAIVVRPEQGDDFEAVAVVVEAAFGDPLVAQLVENIRTSDRYVPELALVAVEEEKVVGHTMLSYATLVGDEDQEVLQLSPVAVIPARQRDGIGGALIRAGIEGAKARHEPLVVVLGSPLYYQRFGFEPCRRYAIEPPEPEMEPAFMVLPLADFDKRYHGRVVFPPAFDDV